MVKTSCSFIHTCKGFANPPGNLTCSLTLISTGRTYTSWIILNWTRPSLSPIPPTSYSIEYERLDTIERYRSDHQFLKIEELELERGIYHFSVRVDRRYRDYPQLPPSKACRLDTTFDTIGGCSSRHRTLNSGHCR